MPAVEIDGRVVTESLDIMFLLERTFPNPAKPMFPTEASVRARAVQLLELERAVFGAWCSYLFRPELPFIGQSGPDFQAALKQVETALSANADSAWFLPYQHPTIVDMQFVSHMERMVASALYFKGIDVRAEYPGIDRWLDAFEELPWYMATKSDYYTHCMDIPPQYGTPYPSDEQYVEKFRALLTPSQFRLPVSFKKTTEPLTEAQKKAPISQHFEEAAWSLIRNFEAVTIFCCRPTGSDVGDWARGNPAKARLSDPYARYDERMLLPIDALLRTVAEAMLDQKSTPDLQQRLRRAAEASGLGGKEDRLLQASACLAYLRDRVGVPRDMSLPAATVLRTYLAEASLTIRPLS